jgi:hypothetical protein
MASVSDWFRRRLGLGTGILWAAGGLGAALLAPLVGYLLDQLGWQGTFWGLGAGGGEVILSLTLFYRDRPADLGLTPYGATADEPGPYCKAIARALYKPRHNFVYTGLEESPNAKGSHVVRKAVIVIALCLTGLVQTQEQRRPPREVWNEVFTKRQGREFPHNKFLAEMIQGRKPGTALDIGIGEGRNALFLAIQGSEVTGFDISDVGVKLAREAAQIW